MSETRDTIVLLGLNKSAKYEAEELRKKGNKVIFIGQGNTADQIKFKGNNYSLATRSGITDFVKTLGLSPLQETKLVSALEIGSSDIRDELAQLAIHWTEFEKKGSGASRFILSGHSIERSFWGDDNGILDMGVIKKLAEALPNAAAKIEDLHLSACYSGKEEDLKEWRNIFPKVTTIWAYSGSAPGAYSGATVHMSRWDTATRDIKLELDRSIVAKTRKGHNVAVWSKRFGYQSKKSQVISEIVSRIRNSESMYQRYFSGNQVVMSTQTGPLREYYNELHDLIGHALVTNELRIYYLPRLKTTIRLIYFDKKIKKKFAEHHKSIIASGYKELGVIAPDFSKLSRKQCLKAIQEFEGASTSSSMNEVIKLKEELTYGLKELRSSHIPDNWI